jgi:hypothetical protein
VALVLIAAGCRENTTDLPARHHRYGVFRDLVLIARSDARGGPYFMDRFEVSRREVRQWLADTHQDAAHVLRAWPQEWLAGDADDPGEQRPAVRIDLPTARAFAAWRFCRLPTAAEWEHAATGGNAYRFPWGDHGRAEWANTSALGLGQPAAIGTFESGRSPGGPYDLIGNVAEWTESLPPGTLTELVGGAPTAPLPPSPVPLALVPLAIGGYLPVFACLAIAPRAPGRLVLGGGYVGIGEPALWRGTRGAAPVLVSAPSEWSDTTGVRLAIDPRGLLIRLLTEPAPPNPNASDLLREFLSTSGHRAVLLPAWHAALASVPQPGPLLPLVRAALRP